VVQSPSPTDRDAARRRIARHDVAGHRHAKRGLNGVAVNARHLRSMIVACSNSAKTLSVQAPRVGTTNEDTTVLRRLLAGVSAKLRNTVRCHSIDVRRLPAQRTYRYNQERDGSGKLARPFGAFRGAITAAPGSEAGT